MLKPPQSKFQASDYISDQMGPKFKKLQSVKGVGTSFIKKI